MAWSEPPGQGKLLIRSLASRILILAMADTNVIQAALNGGTDPAIDDSEETESKVF